MRIVVLLAGLATVAMAPNAVAGLIALLDGPGGGDGKGPLIIHIQRSPALQQGAAATIKQTRCVVQWSGQERGVYDKQCSSSTLRR